MNRVSVGIEVERYFELFILKLALGGGISNVIRFHLAAR